MASGVSSGSGLPSSKQRLVERVGALAADPRPMGAEKLSGTRDKYRLRQGNYRVLYEIEDEVLTVHVVRIAHSKDVHRKGRG